MRNQRQRIHRRGRNPRKSWYSSFAWVSVERTVYATTPPQVKYALTALWRSLSEPVRQLAKWARAHLATIHHNRLRYDENR